jgi:hypothetical protein
VPLAIKDLRPLRSACGVLDSEPLARHRQVKGQAGACLRWRRAALQGAVVIQSAGSGADADSMTPVPSLFRQGPSPREKRWDVVRPVSAGQHHRRGIMAGQETAGNRTRPTGRLARRPRLWPALWQDHGAAGALWGHVRASRNAWSSASRARPLASGTRWPYRSALGIARSPTRETSCCPRAYPPDWVHHRRHEIGALMGELRRGSSGPSSR